MKNTVLLITSGVVFLSGLFLSSCAPVYSELQSAKTAGKGQLEVTASFTSTSSTSGEGMEHLQNHAGVQAAYGILDNLDLRMRFEHGWVEDEGGNFNVIGLGPKVGIIEDWLAFYVPVGTAFGGDIERPKDFWEVHPTILFTAPVSDFLEFNVSNKYLLPLHDDGIEYVAFNGGIGISPKIDKFVFRLEYGIAFVIDDCCKDYYGQFSLGTTFYPFAPSKKQELPPGRE